MGELLRRSKSSLSRVESLKENHVAYYDCHGPLNALSISPACDQVVIAGRDVLKILNNREHSLEEVHNLRVGKMNLNFSSNDVKWCPQHQHRNLIATAATNGAIVIWDLNKKANQKQDRVIVEHTRTVNRIAFHSTEYCLLLSGSQDGCMKLWDLRVGDQSRHTYSTRTDSIRDVQFDPSRSFEFAAALESGIIQFYDMRKTDGPFRTINAHNGLALSIDYMIHDHFLVSSGRDKTIKVWSLDNSEEKLKPNHIIRTVAGVGRVGWRPDFLTEIASCSMLNDFKISIWNLGRPYVAESVFGEHSDVVTGLFWQNSDTIWSCGKDRRVVRMKIFNAHSPVNELPHTSLAWSLNGHIIYSNEPKVVPICKPFFTNTSVKDSPTLFDDPLPYYATHLSSLKLPVDPFIALAKIVDLFPIGTADIDFQFLASNYAFSGAPIKQLCEHNSMIARKGGHEDAAKGWLLLSYIFPSRINDEKAKSIYNKDIGKNLLESMTLNIKHSDLDCLSRKLETCISPTTDHFSESELESTKNASLELIYDNKNLSIFESDWIDQNLLNDMVEHYAELNDAQMVCLLAIILSPKLRSLATTEIWFWQYFELLQRYSLFCEATELCHHAPQGSLREMSQASLICVICSSCNNIFQHTSTHSSNLCPRCEVSISVCSICRISVKGPYIWCQGCGHGGHLHHVRRWFSQYDDCPTGCGHLCNPTRLLSNPKSRDLDWN